VKPKADLRIGDEVRLMFKKKNKSRLGKIVGIYEHFFNVDFGKYQESFLWVDAMLKEISIMQCRKGCVQDVS
jgi:hypothetical protein